MAKYLVTFDHEVRTTYETIVEANSLEEARRLVNEEPFGDEVDEVDSQGTYFEIIGIKKIIEE